MLLRNKGNAVASRRNGDWQQDLGRRTVGL
jgi:hypothetical protein